MNIVDALSTKICASRGSSGAMVEQLGLICGRIRGIALERNLFAAFSCCIATNTGKLGKNLRR
jgi:hypothetical protein